jgi:DNA polymerase/3'-5' exonuclease PolX
VVEIERARVIARSIIDQLAPFCERVQIAGSIRREVPEVGDIELVVIPATVEEPVGDLFGEKKRVRHPGFVRVVDSFGKSKGDAETGKYMQRLAGGIAVDIFTATKESWGYTLAIRTGPAEYSHEVLAKQWVARGFRGHEGNLYRGNLKAKLPEEHDLYRMIGLTFQQPWERGKVSA